MQILDVAGRHGDLPQLGCQEAAYEDPQDPLDQAAHSKAQAGADIYMGQAQPISSYNHIRGGCVCSRPMLSAAALKTSTQLEQKP